MKALMRAAALQLPPIRRLYREMQAQVRREQDLLRQLAQATEALNSLRRQQAEREEQIARDLAAANEAREAMAGERDAMAQQAGREQHLVSELAIAAEEHDVLEMQLYVMRSDLQRAAARNQELSAALHASEARADPHRSSQPGTASVDLTLIETLSAQMVRLSADIARLQSRAGTIADRTDAVELTS